MASLKITLRAGDGRFYVVVKLYHRRDSRYISTGFSVPDASYFFVPDDVSGLAVLKANKLIDNVSRANAEILAQLNRYKNRINKLSRFYDIEKIPITRLMQLMVDENGESLTAAFTAKYDLLSTAGKHSTAKNYNRSLHFWQRYFKTTDIFFYDITGIELQKAENYFVFAGGSINGFWSIAKDTKSIYLEAIKNKAIEPDKNPFIHYRLKYEKTRKRALGKPFLKVLFDAKIDESFTLTQEVFKVSFFFAGMNIHDICLLKVQNFVNGVLHYKRSKTGDLFIWEVSPQIKEIIERWMDNKPPEAYLLNVVNDGQTYKEKLKKIGAFTARTNFVLKLICEQVGIMENVSTYTARHSWASLARDTGVDLSIISKALGHENIKTTQIYLADLNVSDVNAANRVISGLF